MNEQRLRSISSALVLIALLTLPAGCDRKDGGGIATAGKSKINVTLPKGWTTETMDGMALVAKAPLDSKTDTFAENINADTAPVPSGMSFKDAFDAIYGLDQFEGILNNFSLVEVTDVQLASLPAKRIVFKHAFGQVKIQALAYFVIDGQTAYVFTCTALESTYDEYLPVFEEICKSFKP